VILSGGEDNTDGFWVLPGGGVKKYETFEEAVKREIYEETGIINVNVKNCVFSRTMGISKCKI